MIEFHERETPARWAERHVDRPLAALLQQAVVDLIGQPRIRSQEDAAYHLGFHPTRVSQLLNGGTWRVPDLARLGVAYGLSLRELLGIAAGNGDAESQRSEADGS